MGPLGLYDKMLDLVKQDLEFLNSLEDFTFNAKDLPSQLEVKLT